jgi:hypothetical protein
METDAHTSSRTRVPLPRPLDLQSVNLKSSWEKFKQVWDSYEILTGLDKDSDRVRIAHFITAIGHDALDVHNGLPYKTEDEKKDFTVILNLWEKYCVGKTNITYERYRFNCCVQQNETFRQLHNVRLRKLALTCEFGQLTDELIRDRIVCGITDNATKKKLLQEPELNLNKCLDLCRATETSKSQLKIMSSDHVAETAVHAVNKRKTHKIQKTRAKYETINCRYCGQRHELIKTECPAFGKICKKC